VVFMNKDDMAAREIEANSLVELESVTDHGDVRRTAAGFKVKPYNIPRGSIASYYPETNNLMPLSYYDQRSKTPSAKSIPVLVRPMRAAAVRTDTAGNVSDGGSETTR
jgi:anaerobic selenocysteine-containing dehydrogenase